MSEDGDYTPAPHWSGYDFASARRSYMDHVNRSYGDAVSKSVKSVDLVPEKISTDSESPLVIVVDDTGSMGEWPATICSKLPYLEHEAAVYLGRDVEISFGAVGDAFSDRYPIQVRPFVKGSELKESIDKLVIERGGGGSSEESYDLALLYYARNCSMPKAIRKPILILIGDEGLYTYVDRAKANEHANVALEANLSLDELFKELLEKFDVYLIRKPYRCTGQDRSADDVRIQNRWAKYLGDDHVVSLPDPARVVDVIFGILGEATGKYAYFVDELKDRQLKDKDGDKKIEVVMKSLKTIHDPKALGHDHAKSVTKRPDGGKGKKAISLLDD